MYDRSFKYVWGKFINYERKGNFNEYTGTFVLIALNLSRVQSFVQLWITNHPEIVNS